MSCHQVCIEPPSSKQRKHTNFWPVSGGSSLIVAVAPGTSWEGRACEAAAGMAGSDHLLLPQGLFVGSVPEMGRPGTAARTGRDSPSVVIPLKARTGQTGTSGPNGKDTRMFTSFRFV